jgi:GT2 family glycosyltransferase
MSNAAITVLIVTWNSAHVLPRCLACLQEQSCRDFEVLIMDNNSTDGGSVGLAQAHPGLRLRVHSLAHNQGFAAANNLGAGLAGGEWLALLNPDAFPEPDWLARLLAASGAHPDCPWFASRLLMADAPGVLDGEGDVLHPSGLAWRRNHGRQAGLPGGVQEVFSACAAACLVRRQDFLEAGGFDEAYFAYHEDVDLGFRLRLRGGRCLLVPEAVARHVGSASSGAGSDLPLYHGHRNLVWTFFKDMPTGLLLLYLPAHLAMTLAYLCHFLLIGKGGTYLRAKRDALRRLPEVLRQRRLIQEERRVPVWQIHRQLSRTWLVKHWAERLAG